MVTIHTASSSTTKAPGWKLVSGSFVLALVLTILPLPNWLESFRPDWVALVVLYWCLFKPSWFGVGSGWLAGLLQDAVQFGLLGANALGKAVIAYLANRGSVSIQRLDPGRQTLVVFGLLMLSVVIDSLIRWLTQRFYFSVDLFTASIVGALFWPLLVFLFNRVAQTRTLTGRR